MEAVGGLGYKDKGPDRITNDGGSAMAFASILRRRNSLRPSRERRAPARPRRAVLWPERLEGRVLMSTYQVTNLLDHGAGSLRQAVLNANAHAGTDAITFAPPVHGAIVLTGGQLTITGSVTITGPGAGALAVSGHHTSRVLRINGSSTAVSIGGLTIRDGDPGSAAGGGGVLNYGKLTLSSAVVSNNVAASFSTGSSSGVGGAGLLNFGTA